MKIPITPHIHLSPFAPADEEAVLLHMQARKIYESTLRIPFPYTQKDFHDFLKVVDQAKHQHGRDILWAIRKSDDNFLIGGCGLDGLQQGKPHCRAEIGYWLAKPFWGQGITTSVVRKLCDFAAAELGLVKILAYAFADNAASIRVLEKCGFVQEGYLRDHYLKDGRFIDARLFAQLR